MVRMNLEHISSESVIKDPVRKDKAWDVISDFSKFTSYTGNIDKILITGKTGVEQISEWDVTFDGAPLNWIQKDLLDRNNFAVNFRALSGDFDQFAGSLQAQNSSEGCISLAYSLNYKVGIPIIEELFGPVFKEKMQLNFDAIVHGIAGEISKHKVISDERATRRHKVGVHEVMILDGMSIEAKIEDISRQGMMFTSDQSGLEKPVSVQACGLDIMVRELHQEIFDKKYRLVFENTIEDDRLMHVVKMLQSRHVTTLGKFMTMEPKTAVYS
jgi:ribosome-associated toxin RatA of RatAB toxin-antitoxin module